MKLKYKISIEKNGEKIFVDCEKTKRKSFRIQVKENGDVRIVMPMSASKENAIFILNKRLDWIFSKRKEFINLNEKKKSRVIKDGSTFLFLGKECPLEINYDAKRRGIGIKFVGNEFVVITNTYEEEKIKIALEKFYKKEALSLVKERVNIYSKIVGKVPSDIAVRSQKKRWGTCMSNGKIIINYKCIMAPIEVLDYVIVHEMCHLIHLNHSRSFWNEVKRVMPDYECMEKWLKDNAINMEI